MKVFKRVLVAALAAASVLFATGCQPDATIPEKEVSPVEFSVESGKVSQGTRVTFSCDSEVEVDIYVSVDEEITPETYLDVVDTPFSAAYYEVTKNCKIYAIAVEVESGKKSKVTTAEYQVTGPKPATFAVVSGQSPENEDYVYNNGTISLASEAGADIYYAFEKFEASDDYSAKTKYTAPITLSGKLGEKITVYALSVKDNEEGVAEPSMVKSHEYTIGLQYLPLTDTANYTLEGNIAEAIEAVGTSTAGITFAKDIKGYVTQVATDYAVIQDKDASLELYKIHTGLTVGQYVCVSGATVKYYSGVIEITAGTITKDNALDTTVLYYRNLNGKEDFSGLESSMNLACLVATPDDLTSKYTNLYSLISGVTITEKTALLGYVTRAGNTVKLYVNDKKSVDFVNEEASTLKNTVEPVKLSAGSFVVKGEEVDISTVTPGVEFYYSATELTAENYTTGTKSETGKVTFNTVGNPTVYFYAIKTGYNPACGSFTARVLDSTAQILKYEDLGINDATDLPAFSSENYGFTLAYTKGTNNNAPKYYKVGTGARIYGSNTVTLASTNKVITKVTFGWQDGYAPAAGKWTPSTGTYNATTYEWTGTSKSIVFTADASIRLQLIAVEFTDATFIDSEATYTTSAENGVFPVGGGTVALATTVEGAKVYYSTVKALDYTNYQDGIEYTTPVSVTDYENPTTIYTIVVKVDGETVSTSVGKSITYTVTPDVHIELNTELILNGGFENWTSDTEATSWTPSAAGTVAKSTTAKTGSYSLELNPVSSNRRIHQPAIKLDAGTYTMKACIRTSDAEGATGSSYTMGYKIGSNSYTYLSCTVTGSAAAAAQYHDSTTEWDEIVGTFTLTKVTELEPIVMVKYVKNVSTTKVLIDDVSLMKTAAPAAE